MLHRCLCPALLVSGLAAQAVQSLALPDPLDLRPTPARLQSRLQAYDAFGTVTATLPLGLPAFGDPFGNPQLVPLGANLAYGSPAIAVAGATVRVCHVIDPVTGAIVHSGMLAG